MKRLFFSTLVIVLYSCSIRMKPERVLDFHEFKMKVPGTWSKFTVLGVDSNVGGVITANGDTLEFDYGYYSNSLTNLNPGMMDGMTYDSLESEPDTELPVTATYYDSIAGYKAKFVVPNRQQAGLLGIYIDSVKSDSNGIIRFNFYGHKIHQTQAAAIFRAFKTISFN